MYSLPTQLNIANTLGQSVTSENTWSVPEKVNYLMLVISLDCVYQDTSILYFGVSEKCR